MKIETKKEKSLKDLLHDIELEIIFWVHVLSEGSNEIKVIDVMRKMNISDIRDFLHILKFLVEQEIIELIAQKTFHPERLEEYYEAIIRLKPTKEVEELIKHAKERIGLLYA